MSTQLEQKFCSCSDLLDYLSKVFFALSEKEVNLIEQYINSIISFSLSDKDFIDIWLFLAKNFEQKNLLHQALYFYKKALTRSIHNAGIMVKIADLNFQLQRYEDAKCYYQYALTKDYDPVSLYFLGRSYHITNNIDVAEEYYEKSIDIGQNLYEPYFFLANIKWKKKEYTRAEELYRKAIAINPTVDAKNNLAHMIFRMGKAKEAVKILQEIIDELKGKDGTNILHVFSDLIFMGAHDVDSSPKDLLKLAEQYSEFQISLLPDLNYFDSKVVEGRLSIKREKLRVGFVFPFSYNSITPHFLSLVKARNQECFEYYLYHTAQFEDHAALAIKSTVDSFVNISELSDLDAAKKIYQDEIDILIDMRAHVVGHRLGVFCYKPAPIQMSWYDCIAPIGLKAIDYIIGDEIVCGQEYNAYFVADFLNLPHFPLYFEKQHGVKPVNDLPCIKNGYITFASFNRFEKINDQVIDLWSKILLSTNSKLLILDSIFDDPKAEDTVKQLFEKRGVKSDQLEFSKKQSMNGFIEKINNVDIALSPFPFPAVTTSFYTLLQGVPMIAMDTEHRNSKAAVSILKNLDLDELIAYSKEEYLEKAITLASDPERLLHYRKTIPVKYEEKPCFNPRAFQKNFEELLASTWEKHMHERN